MILPASDDHLEMNKPLRCLHCNDLKRETTPCFAIFVCDKCGVTILIDNYKETITRYSDSNNIVLIPANKFIQELTNQCLDLIIKDDVDEVVWAFMDIYSSISKKYSKEENQAALQRFLNQIVETLMRNEYPRQKITYEEITKGLFRKHRTIATEIIEKFLKTLTKEEQIDFLGELIGAYALAVPEPLFRIARNFKGLHQTPDIPPIDDSLPMNDEMILFGWQYFWFYTWLGY